MKPLKEAWSELIRHIAEFCIKSLGEAYDIQGHTLTGSLKKSLRHEVQESDVGTIIRFYMKSYGINVDSGTPASRIPFGGGARGKTSLYIQGLIEYAIKRFRVGTDEAVKTAFRIANAHKRDGNPSQGSYKYSQNGKRTAFIRTALDKVEPELRKRIRIYIRQTILYIIRT